MARDPLKVFDGIGGPRRRGRVTALLIRGGVVVGVLVVALVGWSVYRSITSIDPVTLDVLGVEGQPVVGAAIAVNDDDVTTDAAGRGTLRFEAPAFLAVSAPGYHDATFEVAGLPADRALVLNLNPIILQGRVTTPDGTGVAGAEVVIGDRSVVTEEFGSFEFVAAVPGTVHVNKFAWESTEVEWSGDDGRLDVAMEPFTVRGLRVSGDAAGTPGQWNEILDLAERSAVNSLVFDTKEESGTILYDTQVEAAVAAGARNPLYDPQALIAEAKERGFYTITRVVTFQDDFAANALPDHAIHTPDGGLWTNDSNLSWLDPTDRQAWEYPISLALEACELGFDEIQFDYVRFPTDGDITETIYDAGELDATVRVDTISGFLSTAKERINAAGCAVSADIFAIVMSVDDDQGLGQMPDRLSFAVDAISPMIYPSHYGSGWLGFDTPNDHPSEVVGQALTAGVPKVTGGAVVRPWLQAFGYTGEQVLAQIDEAEQRSLGWLLWNAFSEFDLEMLPPE